MTPTLSSRIFVSPPFEPRTFHSPRRSASATHPRHPSGVPHLQPGAKAVLAPERPANASDSAQRALTSTMPTHDGEHYGHGFREEAPERSTESLRCRITGSPSWNDDRDELAERGPELPSFSSLRATDRMVFDRPGASCRDGAGYDRMPSERYDTSSDQRPQRTAADPVLKPLGDGSGSLPAPVFASASRGRSESLSNPRTRVTLPPISSLTQGLGEGDSRPAHGATRSLHASASSQRLPELSDRTLDSFSRPTALELHAGSRRTPGDAPKSSRALSPPNLSRLKMDSDHATPKHMMGEERPGASAVPALFGPDRHPRVAKPISPYARPLSVPSSASLLPSRDQASVHEGALSHSEALHVTGKGRQGSTSPALRDAELERLLEALRTVQDVNRRNRLPVNEHVARDVESRLGHRVLLQLKTELQTLRAFSPVQAKVLSDDLGLQADIDVDMQGSLEALQQQQLHHSVALGSMHDPRGLVARPPAMWLDSDLERRQWRGQDPGLRPEERDDLNAMHQPVMMRTTSNPSPAAPRSPPPHGYMEAGPSRPVESRSSGYPHNEARHGAQHFEAPALSLRREGPSVLTHGGVLHDYTTSSAYLPHVPYTLSHPDDRHQQQLELSDKRRLTGKGMRRVRKRKNEHHQECLGCQAKETPEWRKGPMGPRTLCNACGLLYAKLSRRKQQEAEAAARASGKNPDDVKLEMEESPSDKQASLEALRAELSLANGLRNRSGSYSAVFQTEGHYASRPPSSSDPRLGAQHFAPYPATPMRAVSRGYSPSNLSFTHPQSSATASFNPGLGPMRSHPVLGQSARHLQNRGRAHTLSHPAARPNLPITHNDARPRHPHEDEYMRSRELAVTHGSAYYPSRSVFDDEAHWDQRVVAGAPASASTSRSTFHHSSFDDECPPVRRDAMSQSPYGWESRDAAMDRHRR